MTPPNTTPDMPESPESQASQAFSLEIASPCSALWSEMTGDDRSRFCQSCQLTVHNLSAMTTDDAQALLTKAQEADKRVCVRFYQREDGTVMTQDCSVGVELSLRQRVAQRVSHTTRWLRWAAGLAIGVALGSMSVSSALAESKMPPLMGAVAMPQGVPPPIELPDKPIELKGDVAPPKKQTEIRGEAPLKPTKKPCDIKKNPSKPTHTMGKVKNPPLMGKPAPPPPKP